MCVVCDDKVLHVTLRFAYYPHHLHTIRRNKSLVITSVIVNVVLCAVCVCVCVCVRVRVRVCETVSNCSILQLVTANYNYVHIVDHMDMQYRASASHGVLVLHNNESARV